LFFLGLLMFMYDAAIYRLFRKTTQYRYAQKEKHTDTANINEAGFGAQWNCCAHLLTLIAHVRGFPLIIYRFNAMEKTKL
jgi:hypothetical protein